MSKYLNAARHNVDKIMYYYEHAGIAAYQQSLHHSEKLDQLLNSAYRSKDSKADVPIIQNMIKQVVPKMEEMKARSIDS